MKIFDQCIKPFDQCIKPFDQCIKSPGVIQTLKITLRLNTLDLKRKNRKILKK